MTQMPHGIAMAINGLSLQRQNGAEKGAIDPNNPVDGIHSDGSQSGLRADVAFIGSISLFTMNRRFPIPHICSMGLRSALLAGQ
jgi:hypothetical protein